MKLEPQHETAFYQADHEREKQHRDDGGGPSAMRVVGKTGSERRAHADHRAHGEVYAAGQDSECLPERDEREAGRLLVDVEQVADRGEAIADTSARHEEK